MPAPLPPCKRAVPPSRFAGRDASVTLVNRPLTIRPAMLFGQFVQGFRDDPPGFRVPAHRCCH